jgi:hypothetical protein
MERVIFGKSGDLEVAKKKEVSHAAELSRNKPTQTLNPKK